MEKDDKKAKQNEAMASANAIDSKREFSKEKLRERDISTPFKNWDSQESQGNFHVEKDEQGRIVSIEGWLQHRPGERPAADGKIQQVFRKEHGLNKNQDAYHVIAHQHGGPTSETHSAEQVKSNLIPADSTINRSYHSAMEQRISMDLARGEQIYCKATISYGSDACRSAVPKYVTYAYYVKSQSGEVQDYVVKEYSVRVDNTPGLIVREGESQVTEGVKMTAAELLKRENANSFYKDEWQGQNPDLPN